MASLPEGDHARVSPSGEDGSARAATLAPTREGLSLTQTIKHRDKHGRLLSVETGATIGAAPVEQPVPVHIASG